MRPARSAALLASALLAAGCGHPLLGAELEAPEVRMTSEPRSFPATPAALPQDFCDGATAGCLVQEVEYDLGEEVPLLDEDGVEVDLRLTDVALDLESTSAPGLDGLESVRIVLLDPVSGRSTVVASWTKPPGPTPAVIHVGGDANRDLAPYLRDGRIAARIEIDYDTTQPMGAFTATLETGFSVVLTVSYLDL
jgi:hypothetical protein